jgi:DNA-binding NtrC family response regulator
MSLMIDTIKRAEQSFNGNEEEEADAIDDLPNTEMVGSSPRMIEIYKTVAKVAPTDATVIIEGETGDRKRADRAHDSSQQPARADSRLFRSIADRSRRRCSKASCSGH